MTKRIFNIYWTAVAAAVAICACTENTAVIDEVSKQSISETVRVGISLVYDSFSTGTTRSSFEWEDTEINDVQIVIVDKSTGTIAQKYAGSKTGIDSLSFMGVVGHTYNIWASANLGGKVNVSVLDDFITGTRTVSYQDIARKGIPMYSESADDEPGPASITLTGENDAVQINMVRMLARIDLNVDKSGLEAPDGFTVNDVKIYNAINSYSPFASGVKQVHSGSIDYSFDKASASDIIAINGGSTITLYAFENMQGELLSSNNDPWLKVPGEITGSSDYCTYLELEGSYVNEGESYGKVTYRMYLGENSTTNFDVKRNTKYTVTLYPTEEEIDGHRGSWKVESSAYSDDRSLAFSPRQLSIESLGSGSTTIVKSPSDFSYNFTYNADDAADAGIVINRTGDSVSIESIREVTESKTVTLHIETTDGKHKDDCVITITPKESVVDYELVLTPSEQTIVENGGPARIRAIYYTVTNGVRDAGREVTSSSTWTIISGSQYIKYAYLGGYTWKAGPGTATVRATYNGLSETATITTAAHVPVITYEMKITPVDPVIEVGESIQFHVEEWKYADGVEVNHWDDIHEYCSWSRGNTRITLNSKGLATGTSVGTVTVTASYNESDYGRVSDYTTVTVVAAAPTLEYIELFMDPDEVEIGGKSYGTVIAHYSDSSTEDVTGDCTWTITSGNSYGSISSGGVFTGSAPGTATVKATYDGKSDTDNVTVVNSIDYIELEMDPDEIAVGESSGGTVTVYYKDGSHKVIVNNSVCSWAITSGSSYGSVNGSGTFTGTAVGTATVKVTYDSFTATDTVTVNDYDIDVQ